MAATGRVDGPLVDLLTLEIDPTWEHKHLWQHPLGYKLAFTYVDLEEGFTESSSANYGDSEVLGRAEMYKTYTGTTNKEIPVTFRFQAQGAQGVDIAEACRREVILPARFLDALKYPVYGVDEGISHAPPPCLLKIGELLFARVIVTAADPVWNGPFHPETLLPMGATVATTFTVVRRLDPFLRYSFEGVWQ